MWCKMEGVTDLFGTSKTNKIVITLRRSSLDLMLEVERGPNEDVMIYPDCKIKGDSHVMESVNINKSTIHM